MTTVEVMMVKKRSAKSIPKAEGCRGTAKNGKNGKYGQPCLEDLQHRENRRGTGVTLPGHKLKKTKKRKS